MFPPIACRMLRGGAGVSVLAAIFLAGAPAHAAVTISSGTTQNMNCANGVCAPTAKDAVLNVGDLGNLLASGSAEVTTTGSGVQAKDIVVKAALSWSTSNALALDAYKSIEIDKPVSVAGLAGLALTANDGGSGGDLLFGRKGNVTFANLSSSLTINGASYTLVNTVQNLANAIAGNPDGDFAMAQSYDAGLDGTYTESPINTDYSGTFEGLGNTISHVTIKAQDGGIGFMTEILPGGAVRDFGLVKLKLKAKAAIGGLIDVNEGTILHCYVTGSVRGMSGRAENYVGGLVGLNEGGAIRDSYSMATVTGGAFAAAGGLAGGNYNGGLITESFAVGPVSDFNHQFKYYQLGGLVGVNHDTAIISNSYATGPLSGFGGANSISGGGLVGGNSAAIVDSYSTGLVACCAVSGGLIGEDYGTPSATYWDLDTSGQSQGAGNVNNDPGITGLTTQQFQSGLPDGFDPTIWGENPKINNGFPYLLNNPPP